MNTIAMLTLTTAFVGLPAGTAATHAAFTTTSPVAAQEGANETARGLVKSVNKEKKTFIITSSGEQAKDITVTINDQTIFMKDGKMSTLDEVVKVGGSVTVTHNKGSASKVESFTTP